MRQKLTVNGYLLERGRPGRRIIWWNKQTFHGWAYMSSSNCISHCACAFSVVLRCLSWCLHVSFWAVLLTETPHSILCPALLCCCPMGHQDGSWSLLFLLMPLLFNTLVSPNQPLSLRRMLYLRTHPSSQRVCLCFCTEVTPVDSITVTRIHFQ